MDERNDDDLDDLPELHTLAVVDGVWIEIDEEELQKAKAGGRATVEMCDDRQGVSGTFDAKRGQLSLFMQVFPREHIARARELLIKASKED